MMTRHVHICPVGFYSAPIMESVGSGLPADRYYFLFNSNPKCIAALEDVMESFRIIGQKDLYQMEIDPFDYSSTITAIMKIRHDEMADDPDSRFYINFTSGTNIVAGACCSASYFIGATLYYVINEEYAPGASRNERVKVIQTPRIPDIEKMKPFARDILMKICSADGIGLPELSLYMQATPQKINHHIKSFMESGLIIKERSGRNVILKGTEQGRMMCSWIAEENFN